MCRRGTPAAFEWDLPAFSPAAHRAERVLQVGVNVNVAAVAVRLSRDVNGRVGAVVVDGVQDYHPVRAKDHSSCLATGGLRGEHSGDHPGTAKTVAWVMP